MTYIDSAETIGKKYIKTMMNIAMEKEFAKSELERQKEYEEDHKDDDLREEINKFDDALASGELNIDFVDTKITFKNVDICSNVIPLSDKQLLDITAMILKDRANGYIVYTEEIDDRIITEIIPMKYIQTLEYAITANSNVTSTFSTDLAFTLKKDAPTDAEFVYGDHIVDCPPIDEYSKRRYRIHIITLKKKV
jgi:hypothetical protein